jgi:acetolactate synthase I/II/III large subunit
MSTTSKQATNQTTPATAVQTGAELLVKNLEAQGVEYVFGIPGAKIDKLFDTLVDSKIKTVLCRHEQNAAFIAAGIGRMTGKAGVCIGTSGPGASNLLTGLATATSEGDPVVALGGATTVANRLKRVHQAMDTVSIFKPVTKYSAEINSSDAISEVVADAFRAAESGRPGASFISLPMDIMAAEAEGEVLTPVKPEALGAADDHEMSEAAALINKAQNPVVLLGMLASQPATAEAIRLFLRKTGLPVVNTYQAAGAVSQDLFDQFGGRVGLFHNQPGDRLLDASDLVITVGYDPIEYDAALWNKGRKDNVIHIDVVRPDADKNYKPAIELIGNIKAILARLTPLVVATERQGNRAILSEIAMERGVFAERAKMLQGTPIHPMRIVHELQGIMSDDTTLCLDMGSFHIWLARYLYSFRSRQVLITNGQQTMGVGLPWAIAASLVRPSEKVISISGDGGFMFSSMELETAVRLKCNLVHIVWIDGHYDMVRFQQIAKYGRDAAVEFGPVDVVGIARACGAHGMMIHDPEEIAPTLKKALALQGPVVVGIPVDYRDNHKLMEIMHPGVLN